MYATTAALDAFRRTWSELPVEQETALDWEGWAGRYAHLWAMYNNDKFEDLATWARYKSLYGLYRFTRLIYNPTRRQADFYAGMVWPGALTEDALPLPDVPLAIPLADSTPPELRLAIGQVWQWSNMQVMKHLIPRWGALLGNVLLEIIDDVEGGKVYIAPIWPGLIRDLELDARSNVVRYALEYKALDEDGEEFIYRKEVDKERIVEYKDDDQMTESENPYGFAPAVWAYHAMSGGLHGMSAIRNMAKFDAVNEQISVLADKVRLLNNAPIVAWGAGNMGPVAQQGDGRRGPTYLELDPYAAREELRILQGPQGGSLQTLEPTGVAQTMELVAFMVQEIEADHPELTMFRELRKMSTVTGPGAERMVGDVAQYVAEARANYDDAMRRALRIAVAVAGYRANAGDWSLNGPLSAQQRKFLPFDLTSYGRGELNIVIMPRPLIPETPIEMLTRERMQLELERERSGPVPPGVNARLAELLGENP